MKPIKLLRSFLVDLADKHYYEILKKQLADCDSVLDVGCGRESPLLRVKKTFYSESIDIFTQDIAYTKKKKIHDKYSIGNIMEIDKLYMANQFDAVIALDVIEHLYKKKEKNYLRKWKK